MLLSQVYCYPNKNPTVQQGTFLLIPASNFPVSVGVLGFRRYGSPVPFLGEGQAAKPSDARSSLPLIVYPVVATAMRFWENTWPPTTPLSTAT